MQKNKFFLEKYFSPIIELLFYVLIGSAIAYLYYHQVYTTAPGQNMPFPSDVRDHIGFAKEIAADPRYLLHFFEPGFHFLLIAVVKIFSISYENGAVVVLTAAYLAFAFLLLRIISSDFNNIKLHALPITFTTKPDSLFGKRTFTIELDKLLAVFLCLFLLLPSFIYLPFLSNNTHTGIGSPTVWHSPTLTMVRVFALYITFQVVLEFKNLEKNFQYYLLSLLLFISCLMKPCFADIFIPSLFIYAAFVAYQRKDMHPIWHTLGLVFPTIVLLGLQFFVWSGNQAVYFMPFKVMRAYGNPIVVIFQTLSFPIAVAMVIGRHMRAHLKFCWILIFVAFMQFALFAEGGRAFFFADFRWGFDVALTLIFIFSMLDFFHWALLERSLSREDKRAKIRLVVFLFALHLFSGIAYAHNIFTGGYFWAIDNSSRVEFRL